MTFDNELVLRVLREAIDGSGGRLRRITFCHLGHSGQPDPKRDKQRKSVTDPSIALPCPSLPTKHVQGLKR